MDTNNNNMNHMEMNNNPQKPKKGLWILIVLVIIIGLIIILGTNKKGSNINQGLDNTGEVNNSIVSDQGINEAEPSSPEKALTYSQAIEKYKGRVIQFTNDCQAVPDNQTFKVGTSIMLDNRAPRSLTVKVGSTYTLGKYGFRTITLNKIGTFLVDCGTSQNVSTIIVQK